MLFMLGFTVSHVLFPIPVPVPTQLKLSQTALMEINLTCSGDYSDLRADEDFIYAFCSKDVKVQNYRMK